jgi:hypothetical protein
MGMGIPFWHKAQGTHDPVMRCRTHAQRCRKGRVYHSGAGARPKIMRTTGNFFDQINPQHLLSKASKSG